MERHVARDPAVAAPASGRPPRARVPRRGLRYFAWVFGAGFALGMIRVPLLAPRIGERSAELIEMVPMLAVIAFAARRVVTRPAPSLRPSQALGAGLLALALLVAAELVVAALASNRGLAAWLSSRDPVSGAVYLAMLGLYAVMPAVVAKRLGARSDAGTRQDAATAGRRAGAARR